jgi:hypothetical protein
MNLKMANRRVGRVRALFGHALWQLHSMYGLLLVMTSQEDF